jgi:hypothetical protein
MVEVLPIWDLLSGDYKMKLVASTKIIYSCSYETLSPEVGIPLG